MTERIKINELSDVLDGLPYPIAKRDAIDELDDYVVQYANGEEPLADVLTRSNDDVFNGPSDLEAELMSHLSTDAVGEPGQSEGEG